MERSDRIAALTILKDRVEAELKAEKAAWAEGARPKQRDAAMIGDAELGTVTMTAGRETWKPVDKAAVLEWAMANAEHLVQFKAHIPEDTLRQLAKNPADSNGEIIPGFERQVGAPYPSFRKAPGAEAVIAQAVRDGSLSFADMLPQLEAGDGTE